MRCISLWQPWASLIGRGKTIETRSWPVAYRGPIAIHAAKRWTAEERAVCMEEPFTTNLYAVPGETGQMWEGPNLPLGAIVATATLWNCVRTEVLRPKLKTLDDVEELAFGNYQSGRWGWCLKDIKCLDVPIPFRGAQGLFEVPDELLEPTPCA